MPLLNTQTDITLSENKEYDYTDVKYTLTRLLKFKNKNEKSYYLNQQIKKEGLIQQISLKLYDAFTSKQVITHEGGEVTKLKTDNYYLLKEVDKLKVEIDNNDEKNPGYKQQLEKFARTRIINQRNRKRIEELEEELRNRDNIISGLNKQLSNNTKQSITTLKPNINITIEEEEEDKEDKSIFDFDNISDISDDDYNPYSEDNIDPATAPSLDEFTANEIDEAREICGYEAWNQLTDEGKLQFLLENEN